MAGHIRPLSVFIGCMFFGSFIRCWSCRASGVSFVLPYTPRKPSRFMQIFFVTCITSIEERTSRAFQYGSSQNIDFFFHMGACPVTSSFGTHLYSFQILLVHPNL